MVRCNKGDVMRLSFRLGMYLGAAIAGLGTSGSALAQNRVPPPVNCQPNGYTYNSCYSPAPNLNIGVLTLGENGFVSQDLRFFLAYQGDGNVVLYFYPNRFDSSNLNRTVLWSSKTSIPAQPMGENPRFIFQTDGNLVAYASRTFTNTGGVVWASGTPGRGSTLTVQNDGNAVITNAAGGVVWATNTCCH